MPKRGLDTATDIMQYIKGKGEFNEQIPTAELVKLIRIIAGHREDTVRRYLNLLQTIGYTTPIGNGKVQEIHWDRVDELIGL